MDTVEENHPVDFFSLSSSDDVLLSQAWDAFEGIEKEKEEICHSLCVSKEDLDESIEGAVDCRSMLKIQEEADAEMTRYSPIGATRKSSPRILAFI